MNYENGEADSEFSEGMAARHELILPGTGLLDIIIKTQSIKLLEVSNYGMQPEENRERMRVHIFDLFSKGQVL